MHHNYTGEKLEKKAESILCKYKKGLYLEKIEPIDVDDFAEFFATGLRKKKISDWNGGSI